MAERIVVHNAACVLPDGIWPRGRMLIEAEGGRILSIGPAGRRETASHEIDALGGFIVPGFVDIHCHGGDGHDFMDGTETAFRAIAQVHARHGTALIAPTTVACSLDELKDLFGLLRQVQAQGTGGAELAGFHLEGPYLAPVMKGAQPESAIRLPDRREVTAILEIGQGLISRWSAAPELPGMRAFARQVSAAGIPLSIAHSEATCEQVLEAYQWGFHSVTHLYSSTTSVRKIQQRVHAGIVEAAYLIDEMAVELIGDGRHVPKELMQMVHKLKGPEKVVLVSDAMRAAGQDVTESYLGRKIPANRVIVEDGVAKLPDRSFYAGSITTADHMLRNAVLNNQLPLPDAVRMMTLTPARLIGADKRKGSLETGKDADFVILDPQLQVLAVFARGQLIDQEKGEQPC